MMKKAKELLFKIGRFIGRIPGVKPLILPAYGRYAKWRRNRLFVKHGVSVLKEFDEIMCTNHFHYAVFAGTLLGAVRERGLLKHDLDIDTFMFNKNYSPRIREVLYRHGFRLLHTFTVADGSLAREETYFKNGVSIDIYFVYSDKRCQTYQCDFHGEKGSLNNEDSMKKFGYVCVRRLEFPVSSEVRRVPFENIEVNIPGNAEEWLAYRYGKDYLIPNPEFKDNGNNPNIFEWEEVKGIMTCFYNK